MRLSDYALSQSFFCLVVVFWFLSGEALVVRSQSSDCKFAEEVPLFLFPPENYIFEDTGGEPIPITFSWSFTSLSEGENCVCDHFTVKVSYEDDSPVSSPPVDCHWAFTSTTIFNYSTVVSEPGSYRWQLEPCNIELTQYNPNRCSIFPASGIPFCVRSKATVPEIYSPINGSIQSQKPIFSWDPEIEWGEFCTDQEHGKLTIFLSKKGEELRPWQVLEGSFSSFTPDMNLALDVNTTYQWKLGVSNGFTNETFSELFEFTVDTGTPPVSPVIDKVNETFGAYPSFSWSIDDWGQDFSGERHFDIYIDHELSATTLVATVPSTEKSWTSDSPFSTDDTFYIRISAVNGIGLETSSEVMAFQVCVEGYPSAPRAVYPVNSIIGDGSEVEISFIWDSPLSWGSRCDSSSSFGYEFSFEGEPFVFTTNNSVTRTVSGAESPHPWVLRSVNGDLKNETEVSFVFCSPKDPSIPTNLTVRENGKIFSWRCENVGDSCSTGSPIFLVVITKTGEESRTVVLPASTGTTDFELYPYLSAGEYTLSVSTNNGYNDVFVEATLDFCVADVSAPQLVSPQDGDSVSSNFSFFWNIEILEGCDFLFTGVLRVGAPDHWTESIISDLSSGEQEYTYPLTSGTWAWQFLIVQNENVITESPVWWFYIRECQNFPPTSVVSVLPPDGYFGDGTLFWSDQGLGMSCSSEDNRQYTIVIEGGGDPISLSTPFPFLDITNELENGIEYEWKITADNGESTETSSTFHFIKCTVGESPVVSSTASPVDFSAVPVFLSWEPIQFYGCGPRSIEILLDETVIGLVEWTVTSFTVSKAILNDNNDHSWFLRAHDGPVVQESEAFTFTACKTESPGIPAVDTLIPYDGSTIDYTTGSFSWDAADFGSVTCGEQENTYLLYMAHDPKSLEIVSTIPGNEQEISLQSIPTLSTDLSDAHWYWAIGTSNGPAVSPTITAIISVWICKDSLPETFNLLTPEPGSNYASPLTFAWEESSFGTDCSGGNTSYQLFIGTSPDSLTQFGGNIPGYRNFIDYTDPLNGLIFWKVEKINAVGSTSSIIANFSSCSPLTISSAPVIVNPANGSLENLPFNLTWSPPPEMDDTCSREPQYHIFISKSHSETPQYYESTSQTNWFSFSFDPDNPSFTSGEYIISIQADNGFKKSPLSNTVLIQLCVPMKPPRPVLTLPEYGAANLPSNTTFHIAPTLMWGETCGLNIVEPHYTLQMGIGSSLDPMYTLPASTSLSTLGTIAFETANLTMATWTWTAEYVNSANISSTTDTRYCIICTPSKPKQPTLLFPPHNSVNITTYELGLQWEEMNGVTDFGKICGEAQTLAELVLFIRNETAEYAVPIHYSLPSETLWNITRLYISTTYYWYVEAHNNKNFTRSEIRNFTTRAKDCEHSDIYCAEQKGVCNDYTAQCDCFEGWTGADCSISTKKELSAGAIGGIAAGIAAFLLIVAIVAAIFIIRVVKQRRRFTIKPPDFEEMRFAEVKAPIINPGEPEPPMQLLEELLFGPDSLKTVWEICKLTAVTESDTLCKALVYTFERKKRGVELIKHLISFEVDEAASPETLFRANSYATKAFKYYSKMIGLPYAFNTLAILLQAMIRELEDAEEEKSQKDENDTSSIKLFSAQYEVDPDKIDTLGDANINVLTLELSCQKFIVQITRSASHCPGEFKQLCAHIKEVIGNKFPEYTYKAIGAFMFLRFYNTAITVPESYGLMPEPPNTAARRQLILLSKVLQNLANSVKFGDKETFMKRLNRFIESNKENLKKFFDRLSDPTAPPSEDVKVPDELYEACLSTIFQQLRVLHQTQGSKLEALQLPEGLLDTVGEGQKKRRRRRKKTKEATDEGENEPLIASTSYSTSINPPPPPPEEV